MPYSLRKHLRQPSMLVAVFLLFAFVLGAVTCAAEISPWQLSLRFREPYGNAGLFATREKQAEWNPHETAIIVCDMWNDHWCGPAAKRTAELAPHVDALCKQLRSAGATVIHAPSDCMKAYADHPARKHTLALPRAANAPELLAQPCPVALAGEKEKFPIDSSDGGCECDTDPVNKIVWSGEHPVIQIAEGDYLSESGAEIWNILEQSGVKNVLFCGVHTNMCVLARSFGLRNLSRLGKNVVLVRDLTDTMYDPKMWPYVSHFTGTDRVVEHIEKFLCPTVSSDQILGGKAFRFAEDKRTRLAMVIAEQEYRTDESLAAFANEKLGNDFAVDVITWDKFDGTEIPRAARLNDADIMLLSARRQTPTKAQLEAFRKFVADGKPVVGIRTASHALSRAFGAKSIADGHAEWPEFDREVLGGNYQGHHDSALQSPTISVVETATDHPILTGVPREAWKAGGSLYRNTPLAEKSKPLLRGHIAGRDDIPAEPVAWTHTHPGGGRVFYTSLGHVEDFKQPAFQTLLLNGIYWASGREVPAAR